MKINATHSLIFSAPMVLAMLDGRKMQTRRVMATNKYPRAKCGDRFWVRENLARVAKVTSYQADGTMNEKFPWRWKNAVLPAMYMPKCLSRITFQIGHVGWQRVTDISEYDAVAEGVANIEEYITLWDSLNAKRGYGWKTNPVTVIYTFRRIWFTEF